MATIVFTEAAKSLARELVASMPGVAVVLVEWSNGTKDNVRGADGKVVWRTVEAPHWTSYVGSWAKVPETEIDSHASRVDDLYVLADAKVKSASGALVVDACDGKLRVEHHAT
jgi:hypothetical protein